MANEAQCPALDSAENSIVIARGGCHCGAVTFTIESPKKADMIDCNCSICSASGYIHHFIAHEKFTLLSGKDMLTSYRFGSKEAEHLFCKICGVKSFYQPKSHPDKYSVNFRILDAGHGITATIKPFDGRNWDRLKLPV